MQAPRFYSLLQGPTTGYTHLWWLQKLIQLALVLELGPLLYPVYIQIATAILKTGICTGTVYEFLVQ